jgi:tRNA pseudouridine55 synthase
MRLGVTTGTGDLDGTVLETRHVEVNAAQLEAALALFRGEIDQVPPMYSALKRDGKPLYEYARAGVTLERAARRVTIDSLQMISMQAGAVQFRVACSKGTYVRTLAEDIGAALGCGAHLTALRRERTGPFDIGQAITLPAIEAVPQAQRDALLLPVDALIGHLPRIDVDAAAAARLRVGQKLAMHSLGVTMDGIYRVYDNHGALTGLVQAIFGAIRPERLVAQGSPGDA